MDELVRNAMKSTTYKIGKEGPDAPNEKLTTQITYHNMRPHEEDEKPKVDKNSRRCDPDNPNRQIAVGFGYGPEKGTYEH